MASEKSLAIKQNEVSAFATKMKNSKLILLTDYRGINVSDVTEIRSKLRKVKAEYKVVKNNVTKRALAENGITELDNELLGPTAIIISDEDYLEPSKIIYEFSKTNDFYKIKGGVIEGKVVTAKEIITLAQLPSREVLISKVAGSLLGIIGKLAIALDQVKQQKETV